jgi:hypothetical protein
VSVVVVVVVDIFIEHILDGSTEPINGIIISVRIIGHTHKDIQYGQSNVGLVP